MEKTPLPNPLLRANNAVELQPLIDVAPPFVYGTYGANLHREDSPVLRFWYTVVRHKWTVVATALIVTTITAIATLKMVPQYESVGRIAIQRENSDMLGIKNFGQSSSSDDWDYTVALDTQVKVLQSESLALEVMRKLGWEKETPASPADSNKPVLQADNKRENTLIGRFLAGLSVKVVPGTRIVEIRYTSPDPRRSAEAVNTLINTYIEQNFKTKYESTMRTSQWLQTQLAELQMKVEASQEKLVRYQKANDILGIDEKQNIVTSKLDQLNKDLTAAQTDRIQREAQYKLAASGDPNAFGPLDSNSLLGKLESQREDIQMQQAQLRTRFGPSYPKVVELDNQLTQVDTAIRNERQKLVNRAATEYRAALAREKMLAAAFDQQKQDANRLNQSAIEYMSLKRDAEANRQLYDGLLQRLKEAGIAAGLRSSNVNVVDVPRVATSPSKPNIPRNIALGILGGMLAGICLAFLRDSMDVTIRDGEQVAVVSSLPELGVIPLDVEQSAGNLKARSTKMLAAGRAQSRTDVTPVVLLRPKSQLSECYRALRTSILLSGTGEPPAVILITSPLPQEGKSMTSANTAVALAQKGSRVLLIDADMRRPSLHMMFGVPPLSGLSRVLSGGDSPENAIVPISVVPTLFLLPAGPLPPQPAELLGSLTMRQLLARWRQEYDHIIIDTPPCLSVTDAVFLSVLADRVVLVIRSGQTTKTALKRTRDLLAHVNANVLGVVLNAMDLRAGSESYHYSYYYSGKYSGRYYDQGANG